jgi:hypothetical protein
MPSNDSSTGACRAGSETTKVITAIIAELQPQHEAVTTVNRSHKLAVNRVATGLLGVDSTCMHVELLHSIVHAYVNSTIVLPGTQQQYRLDCFCLNQTAACSAAAVAYICR